MNINLKEWWPWYSKIVQAFGYDSVKDQLASDILSGIIASKVIDPQRLRNMLSGKPVLVFGAGPSLEGDLKRIAKENLLKKCKIISADGATTALLKVAKIVPDIVVTDLDGNINDLFRANELGCVMVIHAHGDNIDLLRKYAPLFGNILGTTQVEPRPNVYNFGGFTDGDRAVFLAVAMGARLVALAGMDLGRVIGKYSKDYVKSIEVKFLKLKFCKELLEWLASKTDVKLYNVTGQGDNIAGFINLSYSELKRIVDN